MSPPKLLHFVLLLALSMTGASQAATCRIAPHGTGNGASWSSPMDLQVGLATATCTEIWLRAGLYKPVQPADPSAPTQNERRVSFHIRPGVRLYGGFAGHEIRRDQRDPWLQRSVLSGDIDDNDITDANGVVADPDGNRHNNSYHVLVLDGGTAAGPIHRDTVIDGVVVTSGRANGTSAERLNSGGGLLCRATSTGDTCSPTLSNMQFSGNFASHGGAMFNLAITGGVSHPLLQRVQFNGNRSSSNGGAVYNDGRNAGDASPILQNVRFNGNRANGYGGAMYNDGSNGGDASAELNQVEFSGNNASYGGALYSDATGGGRARPVMTNVTFHGNSANQQGGAFYNYAGTNGDGRASMRHVTFSGNSATKGGAIANIGSGANPGNAGPTLTNVILWGNEASQGDPEIHNQNAQPVLSHSIIAGGCPTGSQCSNVLASNPLLGALVDNGGWTLTMKPGTGSPAINAASDIDCPVVDQRAVPRAQGTRCDLGAVEVEVPPCYVDASGSGANNGSNWANAYLQLTTALANSNCGEIRVARGVYTPTTGSDVTASFQIRPGQRVYGGFAGTETTLEQRAPGANPTVLSGDIDHNDVTDSHGVVVEGTDRRGNNSRRIVLMDGTTAAGPILATTVLDGFAITGAAGWDQLGAGLYCNGSGAGNTCSPTLSNLLFSANLADEGGGLYNNGGQSGRASPTLSNVTFRNNSANYGGGGLYNQGWQGGESSPTLTNVTFVGNGFTAMVNSGNNGGNSSPWLNHVTFSNNRSRFGGSSILNTAVNGTSEPVLTHVIAWGGTLSIPDEPECHVEVCNVQSVPVFSASLIADGCPAGSLCGPDVLDADPKLAHLAQTGGATPTMVPDPTGAAVDAGDPATCAERDQRGVTRPQGMTCDIGAVEYRPGGEDQLFDNGFDPS